MKSIQFFLSRFRFLLILIIAGSGKYSKAQSVNTPERIVTKIGENIYAIQHKDAGGLYVQGNSTVIIGEKEVLVVDAPLPSMCKEDIIDIKKWTDKPVRFLVNTHWHPDHQRGNPAYTEAFPGITIISQTETAQLMKEFDSENLARLYKNFGILEQKVRSGKDEEGKPLPDSLIKELKKTYDVQSVIMEDYKNYTLQYPALTFEKEMSIDLGNRIVILKAIKGHTVGDAIVYLPKEKILIAGDHVAWPVPYHFAGNPYEALAGLEELVQMDADIIVPGHGKVLYNKDYLYRVINLIKTVSARLLEEVSKRGTISAKLEEVQKQIDFSVFKKEFADTDQDTKDFFDESMAGLVKGLFYHLPK